MGMFIAIAMDEDCGHLTKGPGDLFQGEQYRSGKAAAGRIPDEFMKVAKKFKPEKLRQKLCGKMCALIFDYRVLIYLILSKLQHLKACLIKPLSQASYISMQQDI